MIRLSVDDVLTVVSLYQQQLYTLQSREYPEVHKHLKQYDFYLPEDP